MHTSKTAVWAFALVFLTCAQAGPARESDEPPQLFILEVGAKEVPVQLGRAFTVDLDGKKVTMKLQVAPHRVFEASGVRFSYPRHFTFEYGKMAEDRTRWTFEGPDTVLILVRAAKHDPQELLRKMEQFLVRGFGAAHERTSDVELALPKLRLKGRRVAARVLGNPLRQDLFAFRTKEGACLLLVQDSLNDAGGTSEGTKKAVELLQETFELLGD
jgi:hypothetical protein